MTTHAMEEAEMLSDKLAVLNHGEVRCVGTPL
jgi:ABC-type multidrug transport system ATPase subunit